MADFLARYPEIDLDLSITDRLVDLIEEQADIAVRSGHIPEGPLIQRKIADLQRVICAAPSYLERRGTPHVAAELKDHDCIVVAGPGLNRWPFKTRGGVDVVEVRPRVSTDDAEAALRLAIEGAGIIRLSDVIVGGPLRDGELVALLTDSPSRRAVSAGRHLSGRAPAAAARGGVHRVSDRAFRRRALAAAKHAAAAGPSRH